MRDSGRLPALMLAAVAAAGAVLPAAEAVADVTQVSAQHAPLFRSVAGVATITATAQDAEQGLSSVSIAVTSGSMTDCSEILDPPSPVPCRSGATTTTATCPLPRSPTTSVDCEFQFDVKPGEIVTYVAIAKPVAGPAATTAAITFAWTEPEPGMAVPVWWHAEGMLDDNSHDRIRLGLFPDSDYGNDYGGFAADVARVVANVFFNENYNFSRTYSEHRHLFDLWVAPWGADSGTGNDQDADRGGNVAQTADCVWTFDDEVSAVYAYLDGRAIFHREPFRDCASFGPRGEGTVSTDGYSPDDWLLVHESAHFLFGLGDEYASGGTTAFSDPMNVFGSDPQCHDARPAVGADPDECIVFAIDEDASPDPLPILRIRLHADKDKGETMASPDYSSDFRDNSRLAVTNLFADCVASSCF